ncbi:MAG: sigma 54-interacting transcriptional regulator [Myxococcales bacterium]|nr:sigma 54-interacting transcriptional regulator [Myxococcales bacterium]
MMAMQPDKWGRLADLCRRAPRASLDAPHRDELRALLDDARQALDDSASPSSPSASPSAPSATPSASPSVSGLTPSYGLVGDSEPIKALRALLSKVVVSDSTVLVQGENGTGKELIARAIHRFSPRRDGAFVAQNCSALTDTLLESELFGHRKGAFTGAIADKRGLFEVADGGTFFLDEIGDTSPALQVKLLRVLQEGTFIPVGDVHPRAVDVRIIAATNRDLSALMAQGQFRQDLYYRINVIRVVAPPLRERQGDVALLARHFLSKQAAGAAPKTLSPELYDTLARYPWPGNVRELENEIERLVVLSADAARVDDALLSPRIREGADQAAVGPRSGTPALPEAVQQLERDLISRVLERNEGNKTRAARELKISRRNLIRKVQKYKLEAE